MPLEIVTFQIGPMENNTYLAADPASKLAVIIDPSFDCASLKEEAHQRGWRISAIWLTHAHFDHIAGVSPLQDALGNPVPVLLHPQDLPLWRQSGGAKMFGLDLVTGPEPTQLLAHQERLLLGEQVIEVRHTPGHTPGHVIFYSSESGAAFCGDVIFYRGIGRTDLPGSSHAYLINSIRQQVLSLPPATRLLSGHGPETTVWDEERENPFL
jgi:glyoxylase-like metal-dependent hydrolase (beta-lactamase superfamily II)